MLGRARAHVFDRVVRVDLEIALRFHGEVEQTVARERIEHMVEERDARVDISLARAVDLKCEPRISVSFVVRVMVAVREAMFVSFEERFFYVLSGFVVSSRNASMSARFSSSVPTVMRRQFSRLGAEEKSRTRMPRSSSCSQMR